MMPVLIIVGSVLLVLIIVTIVIYNGMVFWRNEVKNGWHQIDVQLKRRYDLIPNLTEIVKGYAKHEKEVFENIAKARSMITAGPATQASVTESENIFVGAMKQLFAVVENYPTLKADQNFRQLMEELTSTENKIAYARQYYNDTVRVYNTKIMTFPQIIFARIFGFKEEAFLEVPEFQKEVPKISFQ